MNVNWLLYIRWSLWLQYTIEAKIQTKKGPPESQRQDVSEYRAAISIQLLSLCHLQWLFFVLMLPISVHRDPSFPTRNHRNFVRFWATTLNPTRTLRVSCVSDSYVWAQRLCHRKLGTAPKQTQGCTVGLYPIRRCLFDLCCSVSVWIFLGIQSYLPLFCWVSVHSSNLVEDLRSGTLTIETRRSSASLILLSLGLVMGCRCSRGMVWSLFLKYFDLRQ